MGWDKGGLYYTRSRRVGGRVVREYVGGGPIGELAAQLDALGRGKREADRATARAERERVVALDEPLSELNELAAELIRAVLIAAGFHQHKRGEWRKKRS